MTARRRALYLLAVSLILVGAFLIASYHLQRESLWYDEGWSLWAVRDTAQAPHSFTETFQFVRGSLTGTLARAAEDVHPPLYYLLLDLWTLLTGESVYTVRLLSTLLALPGLAATYAAGARLFDRLTGIIAVILLSTASFFVYYTREARMYSLLLSLSALSVWAYLRWRARPARGRTVVYSGLMAALLYTHYTGALIILTQIVHVVLFRPRQIRWIPAAYGLALVLFLPWVPTLIHQIQIHNGRPLAASLPSDWSAVSALLLLLTSGHGGLHIAPFLLSDALLKLRTDAKARYAVSLLTLWLVMPPAILLALNARVTPVFQIRYTIAVLPAGALLVAYGLRRVTGAGWIQRRIQIRYVASLQRIVTMFLLLWLAYTQLAMYTEFWPDKPRWQEAAAQMVAARLPLEPALTDFADQSVIAYYDRQMHLRRGISLDLSWRDHTPEEMRALVEKLDSAPSVWTVMRTDMPSTWDAVALLQGRRSAGYRDSVMNIIFYRFDTGNADPLKFRFGAALAYESGIGHQFYTRAGEKFCTPVELTLTTLQPVDEMDAAVVWLSRGYNTVQARRDMPLGKHAAGEAVALMPCLDVPADSPRGPYHLRLAISRGGDANRLPVIEGPNLYWGNEIMLAVVSVDQ